MSGMSLAHLDEILASGPRSLEADLLAASDQGSFQDSDGLMSFVNMSSSLVTNDPQYKTGRDICGKIMNFVSTLRKNVFAYISKDRSKVLPGDAVPTTQWDPAVTHYMQFLLEQTGGLSNFKMFNKTYSSTQAIAEFSTDFTKLIFDAETVPQAIIPGVTQFIQGVGQSLRASWDDRSGHFSIAVLGQLHEAFPVDTAGSSLVYLPKIKYYHVSVDSSQQAFTSSCAGAEKLSFNFNYEYDVFELNYRILDRTSDEYKFLVKFLDKAQLVSYKEASNNLESILEGTVSNPPQRP